MSYQSTGPGWYQMHSPDSLLSAGGKDWSAAPWVDWGDNPNTAGPPRIAVGTTTGLVQDNIFVGKDTVTPAWLSNGPLSTTSSVLIWILGLSAAVGAGYLAYSYLGRK